jgi:hypothetical protein
VGRLSTGWRRHGEFTVPTVRSPPVAWLTTNAGAYSYLAGRRCQADDTYRNSPYDSVLACLVKLQHDTEQLRQQSELLAKDPGSPEAGVLHGPFAMAGALSHQLGW